MAQFSTCQKHWDFETDNSFLLGIVLLIAWYLVFLVFSWIYPLDINSSFWHEKKEFLHALQNIPAWEPIIEAIIIYMSED